MECQYIRNRIWMIKKMCNNMTEQEYIKKQLDLKNKIERTNTVDLGRLETVAGVDLAYWEQDGREYAVCCIVVINYRTFEIIEKVSHKDMISVPYIPGCLAFREIPLFMETYKQLKLIPDVVFFDGNGYLHPRHMGLATHAGILIRRPAVGIAKSYYKVADVDFDMPQNKKGAFTDIEINGEIYGRVLRTHADVKPIFLSIGNAVDLDTAMEMTNHLTTKEAHIPLPTRLADIMTHEKRKEYQCRICKA